MRLILSLLQRRLPTDLECSLNQVRTIGCQEKQRDFVFFFLLLFLINIEKSSPNETNMISIIHQYLHVVDLFSSGEFSFVLSLARRNTNGRFLARNDSFLYSIIDIDNQTNDCCSIYLFFSGICQTVDWNRKVRVHSFHVAQGEKRQRCGMTAPYG